MTETVIKNRNSYDANPITELDCLKYSIVEELFLRTADSSYTVARWAFLNRMYLEFYWNAVHAVEKYFKAALLLNGESSIKDQQGNIFGHDITRLLIAVEQIQSLRSDQVMVCPDRCTIHHWIEETLESFVNRLYDLGEPNNRYNLYGFVQRPEDLVKLDALVFKAKNVAQYLDGYAFVGSHEQNGGENLSMRDLLERFPTQQHNFNGSKLADLAEPKKPIVVKNAVLDQNLYFSSNNYEHPPYSVGWSSANSIFYTRIGFNLENENYQGQKEDLELLNWVIENVYLPKALKEKLQHSKSLISKKLGLVQSG